MSSGPDSIISYHQATKHSTYKLAPGPGFLDWSSQPNPFRRYPGARQIRLPLPPESSVLYHQSLLGLVSPQPLNVTSISQLFYNSLSLSAWKSFAGTTWALRVNPSSGNLHPTEAYLACGAVEGLMERGAISHYQPSDHALELRTSLCQEEWKSLAGGQENAVMVGLSSIPWRESWKYGERAYRYCQLDLGHALAALCLSAAGLGWRTELLDDFATTELEELMGISAMGEEGEHGECILLIGPAEAASKGSRRLKIPGSGRGWEGGPNILSSRHVHWPLVEEAFEAARKPDISAWCEPRTAVSRSANGSEPYSERDEEDTLQTHMKMAGWIRDTPDTLRDIVRSRRSAQTMDGRTGMSIEQFFRMLALTHLRGVPPLRLLPWRPRVHLAVFVHRVEGLDKGLYLLVRDREQESKLRSLLSPDFLWEPLQGLPEALDLYLLARGDFRDVSMRLACNQPIASDGCISLAMLAEFKRPLLEVGPWFYPRLFWECGMIGQMLYLEATLAGFQGCGIGCFFDDLAHRLLGLKGLEFQDLYHFAIGGAVEDRRLTTLPAYGEGGY